MMNKIVTCKVEVIVGKLADYDEDDSPIVLHVSTLSENVRSIEVTGDEYENISEAYKCREFEYGGVYLNSIPDCEWLFYKTVRGDWNAVADIYQRNFPNDTIIKKNLYKIQLQEDMIIYPMAEVISLEPQQSELDFEEMPDKTVLKELPDGNFELVRVGNDFQSSLPLDKITRIGERAFEGYKDTMDIDLPNCTFIGEYAFNQCIGLTSVNLPKVEIIQDGAFNECHFLMKFTYPEHVIKIGDSAFFGCMHLKHFTKCNECKEEVDILPENIVSIGEDAFAYTPMDYLSNNPIYDPSDDECYD